MSSFDPHRRDFLKTAGRTAGGAGAAALAIPALATPEAMRAALKTITGGAAPRHGRVRLQLPPLVENGNSVEFSVTVDSPMTETDYVKAIHVFAEKNPQPYVINAYLGPRAGRARVTTRMRLADSQTVHAVAEMSDGTFWSDSVSVVVTLSACIGDLV
ncbi:MAG: SoxY-related AACIE arm protein [Burkholderiales bacterium]